MPVGHLLTLATAGTLPPLVRRRLGLRWGAREELELRALATAVRRAFAAMPSQWRQMPVARAAFEREALAARASLRERAA
jgi:uncharacterized protein (DUF2236 family)